LESRQQAGRGVGVIAPPATAAEIDAQNGFMHQHLGVPLPQPLGALLRITRGLGTQGSVIYGNDQPEGVDAATWPKKGVIYGTLCRKESFIDRPWLVVGENEFELFVMSPSGSEYAVRPFSGPVVPVDSFDHLLSRAVDIMIRSNPPAIP